MFRFIFLLLVGVCLQAEVFDDLIQQLPEGGITVDLRNPVYTEGVLTSEQGGIVTAPNVRIQAKKIVYCNTKGEEKTVWAQGDLIIEYGNMIFVGDELIYNFDRERGAILCGRSGLDPWYFGGKKIELMPGGCVLIKRGYLTTSNAAEPSWNLYMRNAYITPDHWLRANHIEVRIRKLPIFWLPSFQTNLDWIFDSPIKYKVRWGGKQGLRLGMVYQIFSWQQFKAFLRFEYRIRRGPGGGLETIYESPDHSKLFHTISYIARDSSIDNPNQRTRYRLEGIYKHCYDCERFLMEVTYDKMSDRDILTHYHDRGMELETAGRTQLLVHRQYNEQWVANLYTRIRINDFQTLKQEVPSVSARMRPCRLPGGIISETYAEAGYLDFVYEDRLEDLKDFHSTRFEATQRFYRPFYFGCSTLTPKTGGTGIFYHNAPCREPEWLATGYIGLEGNTNFWYATKRCKHVIEPYFDYNYFSAPTSLPNEHYIFDIQDGLYELNAMKYGIRQLLFTKNACGLITRRAALDIYSWNFYDTSNFGNSIPKIYASLEWFPTLSIKNVIQSAWDTKRQQIDHLNVRTDFTASENVAFALEYRQRSEYDWRKAFRQQFFLEYFRNEDELLASTLSDHRRTFLAHAFVRVRTNLALSFELRHGWDRFDQRDYTEYQTNLYTRLPAAWKMRLSYQNRERDHRIAVYFSLDTKKP